MSVNPPVLRQVIYHRAVRPECVCISRRFLFFFCFERSLLHEQRETERERERERERVRKREGERMRETERERERERG